MINSNDNENRIKRLVRRLSTLREDSQEDKIIEECQSDTSGYDIIESIEGILFINIHMFFFFYNPSIRVHCVYNCSYDSSK